MVSEKEQVSNETDMGQEEEEEEEKEEEGNLQCGEAA